MLPSVDIFYDFLRISNKENCHLFHNPVLYLQKSDFHHFDSLLIVLVLLIKFQIK